MHIGSEGNQKVIFEKERKRRKIDFYTCVMASAEASGQCTVLYFAGASSFTGKERERFPAPTSLGKLFADLEARHPGIRARILDSCLVTVNLDYVDSPAATTASNGHEDSAAGVVIQAADEVALIPPVSSG